MAVFLKQEQNTLSTTPWTVHLGDAGEDAQFVQTCRALPACHQSCHGRFALQAKPQRHKLCLWNSWLATEEPNSILQHSKPLDKLNTCDHMQSIKTLVSTEFCAFRPLPCISSLLSFVHFPWLVEADQYVLVLVRPRWTALESDCTIRVTTAAQGLHFLPKRTCTFPHLSPLYNAKPLVG